MGNISSIAIGITLIVEGSISAVSASKNYSTLHGSFKDFFTKVFWTNITDSYNSAVLASILGITFGLLITVLGILGYISGMVSALLAILISLIISILLIISASKARSDIQAQGSIPFSIIGSIISIGLILVLITVPIVNHIRKPSLQGVSESYSGEFYLPEQPLETKDF